MPTNLNAYGLTDQQSQAIQAAVAAAPSVNAAAGIISSMMQADGAVVTSDALNYFLGSLPSTAGGTGTDTTNTTNLNNTPSTSTNPLTSLGEVGQAQGLVQNFAPNGPPAAVTSANSAAQAAQNNLNQLSLDPSAVAAWNQAKQNVAQNTADAIDPNTISSTPYPGSVPASYDYYGEGGDVPTSWGTTYGQELANNPMQQAATQAQQATSNAQTAAQNASQATSGLSKGMSGIMAVVLEVMVGLQTEKTTAKGGGAGNILELGGLAAGATFSVMMFMQKLFPFMYNALPVPNAANIAAVQLPASAHCALALFAAPGCFAATVLAYSTHVAVIQFDRALLIAGAVTAAAVAAGVLAGEAGNKNAPTTAAGNTVNAFTGALPDWADSMPSTAVSFFTAGITLASLGFTMSPTTLYQQFPVNTVNLAKDISSATGQSITAANVGTQFYVAKGAGANGADEVMLVSAGPGGMSNVQVLNLTTQGYVIGQNGPMTSFKSLFTPTLGANNTVTGFTENPAALTALQQQSACLAIAGNPNISPAEQQAALANCASTANHNVTVVPTGG